MLGSKMLPVDTSSRPLQDMNSEKGEEYTTRHVEVTSKKDKRKGDEGSDGESENKHKKKHKKDRKKDKKNKKRKHQDVSDGNEEKLEAGEVVDPHPLVTLTNIDPDEIPDQPVNKFLMRGDPKKDNDRNNRKVIGNERDRGYKKRREWGGDFYRRTRTTKSGRIVKGRGKFCFRTPSRSRSRSITPIHWRKEEARVIKMSEFEKLDAERKRLEATKSVNGKDKTYFDRGKSVEKQDQASYTPKKKRDSNIDYNALDYEEPGDHDHELKKQVPSLVQYPLPGAYNTFKSEQEVEEDMRKEEENQVEVAAINKRSDFLAMALGVQIKTGEDPPDNEIVIGGLAKQNKNKFHSQDDGNMNRFNQDRSMYPANRYSDEGRFYRPPFHQQKEPARQRTPPVPQIASKVEEKKSRNKFETEKKAPAVDSQVMQRNGGRFDEQRRVARDRRYRDRDLRGRYERDRDRFRRRGGVRRSRSKERRRSRSSSRGSKDRRRSRSLRRSRSGDRSKDSRRPRSARRSRSNNRKNSKSRKRSNSRSTRSRSNRAKSKSIERRANNKDTEKSKDEIKVDKMDAEEKYKKLLILRKKMELLELKKKKEEEQKLIEEKQRKAKEESEMLEKAKRAKREAIEKEKLLKSYKVLQELDGKKDIIKRRGSSSSSTSSSSSSSNSSSSSDSTDSDKSRRKRTDTLSKPKRTDRKISRSRSRSRKRSSERKLRTRSRSRDRKYYLPKNYRR